MLKETKVSEKLDRNYIILGMAIFIGVGLRFWAMTCGSGFDFESYTIVGRLVYEGKNVYAETTRYNYGPIFFLIQGLCYSMSQLLTDDIILTYRVLIVLVLTFADLGIAFCLMGRYSLKHAIVFFLNPVSIIITGFHNQFDNIAIFLILCSCFFYNEDEKIHKKDVWFALFVALSLTTKHLLFMLPFWLFVKPGLCFKKRILYSVVPVVLFLLSFIPFIWNNIDAAKGVLYNVFLYRSSMYAMLMDYVGRFLKIPLQSYVLIFIVCLAILAFLTRNHAYEYQVAIYLLAQVVFASAGAAQYLAIPVAAVCVLNNRICRWAYFLIAGFWLFCGEFGIYGNAKYSNVFMEFSRSHGYALASLVLLILLLCELKSSYLKDRTVKVDI